MTSQANKEDAALWSWFCRYAPAGTGIKSPNESASLGIDEIQAFFDDLGVEAEGRPALAIAHHLGWKKMGIVPWSQWRDGLRAAGCLCLDDLLGKLPDWAATAEPDGPDFEGFYQWAFQFILTAPPPARFVDVDLCIAMWQLIYGPDLPPILERFIAFLTAHPSIKTFNRDLWAVLPQFMDAYGDRLDQYDPNEAWPSLYDDFVKWVRAQRK